MRSLSGNACKSVLALLLLFSSLRVSAQKEPVIWFFGDHNGIDFRSGSPVAISNPNVSSQGTGVRGVATVTDANGNLLFYAENETVYNSNHDTMQNGSKMKSVWAAEQTFLTVRALHDTTLYYLFTTMFTVNPDALDEKWYSPPELWYSIIDMKANNGLGAVTTKNVPLFDKPTTQLCAIRHCNERDIWIVTHEEESDAYYAFLVTPAGVSSTPVISHSGRELIPYGSTASGFSNTFGYMKGSPDGKKIAASWTTMGVDLSDFDNATGKVSNSIDLNLMNNTWAIADGVEFSPNSGVLYADYTIFTMDYLYQYNVNAGSAAAIRASKTKLEEVESYGRFTGMQRGPDNKIYVALILEPYVAIIHDPDVVGIGCNYVLRGLALNNPSSYNFPAYMESKYYPEPTFTFSAACPPERVSFDYDKPGNVMSVKWDFDDPSSGSANTSTALSPVHEFTASGTYRIKLIRFLICNTDTLEEEVSVTKFSNLGPDTTICGNETLILDAGNQSLNYTWQDGSTNRSFTVSTSGIYSVTASNGVCTATDSVKVDFNKKPVLDLGMDKEICGDEVVVLGSQLQNIYSYVWEDGSNSPVRNVDHPGTFRLTATNECGSKSDDIIVRAGACILAVPNAFTPDGDGKNDKFSISKTVLLPSFTMQVFNRWGQKIFESRDQSQGWTGTFAGKLCDTGNYAYVIQYRTNDGAPVTLKGMVLLLR